MKTFYKVLKVLLWLDILWFAGTSIYQCIYYLTNPTVFDYTSVAWYIPIIIIGVMAVAIAAVLLIVMKIVKNKIKKKEALEAKKAEAPEVVEAEKAEAVSAEKAEEK